MDAIKKVFDSDPYARSQGIEFVEVGEGFCRARLQLGPEHANFMGMPHGAAVYSVADAAFSGAVNSIGGSAVALNVNINYLAPAPSDGVITAEARVVGSSRRTASCRIEVFAADGTMIAWCAALAYRRDKPLPGVE